MKEIYATENCKVATKNYFKKRHSCCV